MDRGRRPPALGPAGLYSNCSRPVLGGARPGAFARQSGDDLRTGDALGASGLILIGDAVDPYDPACVRATMGAIFAQRLVRLSPAEFAAWKRFGGCRLVGTSPHGAHDYRAVVYPPQTVLFMGGERRGLSEERRRLCDHLVCIPMVGRSDSLNLAVATGILLYEVFNQRRENG